ncbi:sialate:O-sulfotransferase 2 isoform X2 [Colius striatus]|uniref:sialate:O-sulfotransferase 2 isoform X2 n=1 Tax=Colius striatus TaxID=57412 RepID=UPI002B1D135A|nr:sialate:O-sulfotransferase 2 isoform X2 [Colius striatus]
MAKLKLPRCFRRRPVRFLTLLGLYLAAGSLLLLRSGLAGEPAAVPGGRRGPGAAEGPGLPYLGVMRLSRGFGAPAQGRRRQGPWLKSGPKEAEDRGRAGEYGGSRSRAPRARSGRDKEDDRARYIGCYVDNTRHRTLRGVSFFDYKKMTVFRCQDNCAERGYLYAGLEFGAECYCGHKIQAANASESECNMECKGERSNTCGGINRLSIYRLELAQESARRYGSAIFRGCFHRPDNVSLALPVSQPMPNMSVDKCVDFCTEKEYPLSALAGTRCHCGFPTTLFTLHEREDEQLCAHKCAGEEFESCGTAEYLLVYQTQVQDNRCMDRRFLPSRAKQLVALASFPGAGNTWARHLIELATGFYTGSYYFDGSLYNKEWPEFVANYAPWWATHALDWLRYGRNVLVVHFEDLKRDLYVQLQRMVGLLGIRACQDRLLCVESQKDGNFKRSGLRKLEYDPYTPEMRRLISGYIRSVDAALKLRNLSGVPDDYYPR